jgi:peptidoglycan/xylan/chitin deacetylase (PgdA/CDA1 family)
MATEGELYDDFSTFEEDWQVLAGTATVEPDAGFVGAPGLRMETDDSGLVRVERRYYQPVDYANRGFSLAVRLEETTVSNPEVTIRLQDLDGDRARYTDAVPEEAAGEWVRFDPGAGSDGDIDLSTLTRVRIEHYARDGSSTLRVSDVRTVPKPETGTVFFGFVGSHENLFSTAVPVLEEAGYPGAVFAPPDRIGAGSGPTVADYEGLVADGWELGVTTGQPLTEVDDERAAVEEAVTGLEGLGVDATTSVFRPPAGDYTATTLGYAADRFDLTFVGKNRSAGTNTPLTDVRTVLSLDTDNVEWANTCIEAAAVHNQTAPMFFTSRFLDDREAFAALVDRVSTLESEGRLTVVTPSELAGGDDGDGGSSSGTATPTSTPSS